jgi:hypothetical protein
MRRTLTTERTGRPIRVAMLAAGLIVAVTSTLAQAATTTTVTVRPSSPQGWSFIDDNTDLPGSGTFVQGPAPAPLGVGSAQLSVTGPTDRQILATSAYAGTTLASVTSLGYSSYQSGPTLAPSLQFDVRYRTTDTLYGGRLVFEPYQSNTVGSGWQTWDALAGTWWASKTTPAGSNGLCPQAAPCTWNQVLANWPNAVMSARLLLKVGGNWPASSYNVDALKVGAGDTTTMYDFEPDVVLTSKEQCKNGGWATSTAPTYRNQGDCVSAFAEAK